MKKIGGILLFLWVFFSFFISCFSASSKYDGEKLVKAVIYFQDSAVTTKNLENKLTIPYFLKYATVKIRLDYIDETLNEKINHLSFVNLKQFEQDYQILMRHFGMHQEIEKVSKDGVLLDSVTIVIKQSNLNFLLDKGYRISLI